MNFTSKFNFYLIAYGVFNCIFARKKGETSRLDTAPNGGYDAPVQFLLTAGVHSNLVEYICFGWYFSCHVYSKHVEYYPLLVEINELG